MHDIGFWPIFDMPIFSKLILPDADVFVFLLSEKKSLLKLLLKFSVKSSE